MKRRKFGVYFEKDFVIVQTLAKRYIIKYFDIEKMTYVKWTIRNYFLTIYNHELTPGSLHIYIKCNKKNKLKHISFYFKYKNIDKIPQKLRKKTTIIEKL